MQGEDRREGKGFLAQQQKDLEMSKLEGNVCLEGNLGYMNTEYDKKVIFFLLCLQFRQGCKTSKRCLLDSSILWP